MTALNPPPPRNRLLQPQVDEKLRELAACFERVVALTQKQAPVTRSKPKAMLARAVDNFRSKAVDNFLAEAKTFTSKKFPSPATNADQSEDFAALLADKLANTTLTVRQFIDYTTSMITD